MCVVGAPLCNSTFLIPFERNANSKMRQKAEKTPMEKDSKCKEYQTGHGFSASR